jgi:hypothetical protein
VFGVAGVALPTGAAVAAGVVLAGAGAAAGALPADLLPLLGRIAGSSDHDAPIRLITMPIPVITMLRSA